jgi:hypothetical protein
MVGLLSAEAGKRDVRLIDSASVAVTDAAPAVTQLLSMACDDGVVEMQPSFRASDSDREEVAERLRHATSEGRITGSELEERLEALHASRTQGELLGLVADLPATPSPSHPSFPLRRWAAALGAGALLLVALPMLALGRVRTSVAVVPTGHPRQLELPRGFAAPHPGLIVATFTLAAVVVLLAAVVLVGLSLRSRST